MKITVLIPIFKVLVKWLGEDSVGEEQFDAIDITNMQGQEKVLFKVVYRSINQIYS